jgi:putative salt-induced outer membrane protein YdiY
MLSVAYYLDDRVRLWGETANGTPTLPAGFGDIILLTPTDALRAALGPGRRAEPIDDSWQWLYAPSPAAPGPIAN